MSRLDFIECAASSIAGTNGNGAVTMVAVTGKPTFTLAFGAAARMIDYVIVDETNHYYEKGYGSVAAMVLTRSVVHETWNGTAYSTANTPLAFGASPTTVKVYLAPTADAFMPVPPAIVTTLGSDTYKGYQISAHYATNNNPGGGDALGATTEYYVPYLCLIRGLVDGFGLDVATSDATGGVGIKAGLYEVGSDGLPGPCITLFNALPVNSTGFITDTNEGAWSVNAGPIRVVPGWFYVGFMSNSAIACIGKFNAGFGQYGYPPLGRVNGYGNAAYCYKSQQNSYATGMPTGTPAGSYSFRDGAAGLSFPLVALKIGN